MQISIGYDEFDYNVNVRARVCACTCCYFAWFVKQNFLLWRFEGIQLDIMHSLLILFPSARTESFKHETDPQGTPRIGFKKGNPKNAKDQKKTDETNWIEEISLQFIFH